MQLSTAIRSRAMRVLASEGLLGASRAIARARRAVTRQAPVVHYFHQVDDPYSHMVVQKLLAFASHCSISIKPHLVSPPPAAYQGDATRFTDWALRDAQSVASGFGVTLGTNTDLTAPTAQGVVIAQNALSATLKGFATDSGLATFVESAIAQGTALWNATPAPISNGAQLSPVAIKALADGDKLRARLGHYQGAMFWFDGEWYWGLDRLHLLENRLQGEGFVPTSAELSCPIPDDIQAGTTMPDCSDVTLEYFPSLRSPYTAIGHPRVLELIERTGVNVQLRPVMPMLMRGVSAPREKQRWIISDAAREARYHNIPFGNFVDPFGEPVKRAFALFPAATRLGKGMEFTTAYLTAAWADGTDISSTEGLAIVAANAGLDFTELQRMALGDDWQRVLTENVDDMLAAGLWGVPSFRVTGGTGSRSDTAFVCWGQDRLWRVSREIIARAS